MKTLKINWFLVASAVALAVMMYIWPFSDSWMFLTFLSGVVAIVAGAVMAQRLNKSDAVLWTALAVVLAITSLYCVIKAFLAGGQNGGHALGAPIALFVLFAATAISLQHQLGKHSHWYYH